MKIDEAKKFLKRVIAYPSKPDGESKYPNYWRKMFNDVLNLLESQNEVLEIFAERLKFTAYPMDDVYTFEVSQVRNPNEFDVIAKWLKDRI